MKTHTTDLVLYASLAVISLIVLLGASGLALLTHYHDEMQQAYDAMTLRTSLANAIREVVSERSTRLHRIVLIVTPAERAREIEEYNALMDRFHEASGRLAGILGSAEEKQSLRSMLNLAEHGWRMQHEVVNLLDQHEEAAALDTLLNTVLPVQDDVLEQVGVFTELQRLQVLNLKARLRDEYLGTVLMGTIIAILVLLLAGMISLAVRRRVAVAEASAEDYANKLQCHAEQLEERVAERTHDLATARDDAVRASQAKGLFLANISHELRTPLNAIIGYSEMLEEDALDRRNSASIDDLRKIQGAARNLLELINALLDLTKIEAGHMPVVIERFTPAALLDEVMDGVRPMAEKNGNHLRSEIDPALVEIETDRTKLRQILLNLVSNACKFTARGEVRVHMAGDMAGGCWIRVEDTGIGMDAEQLRRVFEPFVQADASTTRKYGGTGLGLPLAKDYLALLGGQIEAESSPGVGSRFTVLLPARPVMPSGEQGKAS